MATSRPAAARGRGAAGQPMAAYVLHQYDWSESSLIVELFTRAQGRVVVAAKGAKRPTSQLRAVLLPFQPITVLLGRAPADAAAEIHTLRSAEWTGGAPRVAPAALFPAFYCSELLLKLLARHDPHPALFDAYAATLAALPAPAGQGGEGAAVENAVLRAFELRLLRETGVLPALSGQTATQQALRPDAPYRLDPEHGLAPALGDDAALSGASWLALERALQGDDAGALVQACAAAGTALRGLLRGVLHYHLGSPGALRTRQVMIELQRLTELPPRPPGATLPPPTPAPAA